MTLQALLDDGDEVLIPSPDYPTVDGVDVVGAVLGAVLCDETQGWESDIADLESKIERIKALVVIN